jgi:hypothetical protein
LCLQTFLCIAHRFDQDQLFDRLLAAAKGRALSGSLSCADAVAAGAATGTTGRGGGGGKAGEEDSEAALVAVAGLLEAARALGRAPGGEASPGCWPVSVQPLG